MKILENEYNTIIELYNAGNSCKKIAEKYNVSDAGIQLILKRNNIKLRNYVESSQRKYTIDENFFEKIDTEEKAYFLGLLEADGCNYTKKHNVQIALQKRDDELIYKLNSALKSNRPLKFKKRQTENRQDQTFLRISNKKLSDDLVKLGCTSKKSLTLKFPTEEQVPFTLLHHFLRGYFDGDGTVYAKKDEYTYRVAFCVSDDFGNTLKEIIKKQFDIYVSIVTKKNNKIKEAVVSGGRQIIPIINWMYKDATIYLQRKKDKIDDILQHLSTYQRPYSSKYTGISFYKEKNRFGAYCDINKHRYFIGLFNTDTEAATAYNEFIIKNKFDKPLNKID